MYKCVSYITTYYFIALPMILLQRKSFEYYGHVNVGFHVNGLIFHKDVNNCGTYKKVLCIIRRAHIYQTKYQAYPFNKLRENGQKL